MQKLSWEKNLFWWTWFVYIWKIPVTSVEYFKNRPIDEFNLTKMWIVQCIRWFCSWADIPVKTLIPQTIPVLTKNVEFNPPLPSPPPPKKRKVNWIFNGELLIHSVDETVTNLDECCRHMRIKFCNKVFSYQYTSILLWCYLWNKYPKFCFIWFLSMVMCVRIL